MASISVDISPNIIGFQPKLPEVLHLRDEGK